MGEIREVLSRQLAFFAKLRSNIFVALARNDAMRPCHGGGHAIRIASELLDEALEFPAVAAKREIEQISQPAVVSLGGKTGDSLAKCLLALGRALENMGARRCDQFARRGFVEDLEGGRDSRFERKARQQILAKGMNGLDLETAWCFKRQRKQSAGTPQIL